MLKKILCAPVRLYRRFISPAKPPCCRFTPSCSEYFILAVEEWGVIGVFLALWRILRCNPWGKGGYDPVPKRRKKLPADRKNKNTKD